MIWSFVRTMGRAGRKGSFRPVPVAQRCTDEKLSGIEIEMNEMPPDFRKHMETDIKENIEAIAEAICRCQQAHAINLR